MVGAGAALLYAATRDASPLARSAWRDSGAAPSPAAPRWRLIDWAWAARVAERVAGQAPSVHPPARARLEAEYQQLLREIEQPIAAYTGSHLSLANTTVEVLDRPAWIRANMANFRQLLEPVEEFYAQAEQGRAAGTRLASSPAMRQAARLLLTAELGLLVGYLARRVLGQYDLALSSEQPLAGGKLYFVEPNLRQVEQALALPRDDLRRWVGLHEATHALEFELHPWVRAYLGGAVRSYVRLLVEDMRRHEGENMLVALATRLATNLRRGHTLMAALMTPEQRELLSRLQALMSLAEGYSNHVMNAVGRSLLPHFDLVRARVEHRQRQRSQAELLFLRITGLSMKMEQYQRGEQFVDRVAHERGIGFANRAWESPESLPTEEELREPARWLARMEAATV